MLGHGGGHHFFGSTTESDQEVEPLRITDRRMLAWFVQYLKPHWVKVMLGTLATVLSSAAQLAPPYITGKLIVDNVIRDQHYDLLPKYIFLLIGAYFVGQLLGAVRMKIMHVLGQRFVYQLRLNLYEHLQGLSLSYFESRPTGDIMSRLSNDVNAVEDMVVHGTDQVVSSIMMVAGTVTILFVLIKWQLILAGFWPLPIFVVALLIFAHYIRPIYRKIREDLGDINTELQENIAGMQVVKAFAREDYELESFRKWSHEYYKANVQRIGLWTTFFPFIGFLTSMGSVGVLWYGAGPSLAGNSVASAGEIVMFLGYLMQFYGPVGMLIRVYDIFNRALAALSRIFQIFDEESDIQDAPGATELTDIDGEVMVDNVTFKYKTGEIVLKGVNVHARPGETVALVGRSGAGKTSLINLIPRFYDPLEGSVTVDGHDVRQVTKASLRSHIALVLQETFLFNGTVNDNIVYGRLEASQEEIIQAAKAAYAHDFIMELSKQYETQLGERGVKLSGGQRQRIAIARALLADPTILILDEATSLVDTEAEQQIQKALENLMQGRTVFVIAHRLSTIRNADKIVVIEGGEVVERGNHADLMEQDGLYADMYQRQFDLESIWGLDQDVMKPQSGA